MKRRSFVTGLLSLLAAPFAARAVAAAPVLAGYDRGGVELTALDAINASGLRIDTEGRITVNDREYVAVRPHATPSPELSKVWLLDGRRGCVTVGITATQLMLARTTGESGERVYMALRGLSGPRDVMTQFLEDLSRIDSAVHQRILFDHAPLPAMALTQLHYVSTVADQVCIPFAEFVLLH